jgi:dihydrofolate reductase
MVVMGRKTADGFAKPLRNRTNIVMTRSGQYPRPGFQVASRVQEVMDYADHAGIKELWIIGGGTIYDLWLPYADLIHLTEIDVEVEDADVYFPVEGMADFEGTSVTTVEDPLVRFWTLQRAQVGTRRDMPRETTSAVVMDLNQPVAIWTADGGTRDIDTFMAGLGTPDGD